MILYPFFEISVYNFATPTCVQSRPIIVNTWPSASDLVMVPSMSETTIKSELSQRKILAVQATAPDAESEKVIVLEPFLRLSCFSWSEARRNVLT